MEQDDGSKMNFIIIGESGKEPSMRRDAKGNLEFGNPDKIKFIKANNLEDLIICLNEAKNKLK